ncbi:MAG: amino acid ABC transporter permease [candidate division NC10 bacterium]|nr:amino acid ABC transporter permease [candidate division NC10 bacterium]
MTYTFHWEVPLQNLPLFLWGALATLEISGIAVLLGLLIATCGALARLYVEVIRNTPFLVQLFYVYFGLVVVGINLEAFSVAILTLTINCGAYCTEIIRAGIQSIHRGQTEAGLSLGMTQWQVFRYVILMPTLRVVWPPLASQFIATMLGSSVVSQISAEELTYAGMFLESRTFRTFEIFFAIAILYFVMARLFSFLFSLTGQKVFREAWGQL